MERYGVPELPASGSQNANAEDAEMFDPPIEPPEPYGRDMPYDSSSDHTQAEPSDAILAEVVEGWEYSDRDFLGASGHAVWAWVNSNGGRVDGHPDYAHNIEDAMRLGKAAAMKRSKDTWLYMEIGADGVAGAEFRDDHTPCDESGPTWRRAPELSTAITEAVRALVRGGEITK